LGKKQKIMTAIAMAAEGLEMAAQLLSTVQNRSAVARKRAEQVVSNLRENTSDVAEQLVDTVSKRLHRKPSAMARALPFAAGVGVGVGAALLFAPMPGARMRANLYKSVTGSHQPQETPRTDWR